MARILVVDDEARIAQAVQLALEADGHEVITAGSKEAGEAAAVEQKPDLMIVDVMMPEGTEGFHLVWKMRQMKDEALREVPIIMATGIHQTTNMRYYPDQTDGTYQPGEYLPVQGWLDKPVQVEDLLAAVSKALTK
jgi:twitching motility two-component system response regulator PilH